MNITWSSSPNYSRANRGVGSILGIVLHDVEGTSAGALATFKRANGVSAHYVIAEDGALFQCVQDHDIAYHVAAFGGNPALNRNRPDWLPAYNGAYSAVNGVTIGIELAGYAATGFGAAQYATLNLLLDSLCAQYNLARTLLPDAGAAATIVTHGWLQTDRTDPGPLFDWDRLRPGAIPPQEVDVPNSPEDQAILDVVHGLGANADSIAGWINLIGALEAQLAQAQAPAPPLEKVAKVTLTFEDGSTQEIATG